jgi:hypothetical protein
MRHTALPGEIAAWDQQLASLSEDRRASVVRMLAFVIGDCAICDGPVRRCDPRTLARDGFRHLRCTGAPR